MLHAPPWLIGLLVAGVSLSGPPASAQAGAIHTRMVKPAQAGPPTPSAPRGLRVVDGTLLFFAAGSQREGLWRSDGTAAGTVLITDVPSPYMALAAGSTLFFAAGDWNTTGRELWKSDGTATGTGLVKDIWPGRDPSEPNEFVNVDGTLFFSATDASSWWELWKSDGTESGTGLVKDINPGHDASSPNAGVNVNGTLFFDATDGPPGGGNYELWKSDGTADGTVLVKDVNPGPAGSYAQLLTNVGGTVYFSAASRGTSYEDTYWDLWKSDGTTDGTVAVKHLRPMWMRYVGGKLFFAADDGAHGVELWTSDGTSAGTRIVRDINPGGASGLGSSRPRAVGGTLFFRADDGVHGHELWKSDGTAAGTRLVKDIRRGSASSSPYYLTNVNGTLLFTARDRLHGRELWRSDGTTRGTALVSDITHGSSRPRSLTNLSGTLMFAADDGRHGAQLWETYPPVG